MIRKAQGITVRKLGEMCQTDYSNLSRSENGQMNIHLPTLKGIAEALNINIKDFL
jgi:transcriptional regulator with XRE-family HTH domain